jgi:hypothetical protein
MQHPADALLNLYGYGSGKPLNGADPYGLLFGWGYGKYCGFSRRASCPPGSGPPPDDALDAACERHDCCQCSWWTANPYHISKCSGQLCQESLDAWHFGCQQSYPKDDRKACDCEKAAVQVGLLFCRLALNWSYAISHSTSGACRRIIQKKHQHGVDNALDDALNGGIQP